MDLHVIKSKFHAPKALQFQLWKSVLIEKRHLEDSNLLLKVLHLRSLLNNLIKHQVLAKMELSWKKMVWLTQLEINKIHHNTKHQLFLKRKWTQFVNGNWVKMVQLASPSNLHVMSLVLRNHNLRDAQREASFQPDLQKHQRLLLPKMVANRKIKHLEPAKKAKWWNKRAWLSPLEIKWIHHNMKHQLSLNINWTQFVIGNWVKMVPLARLSNHHVMRLVSRNHNLKDAQREASSQADLQKLQKLKL